MTRSGIAALALLTVLCTGCATVSPETTTPADTLSQTSGPALRAPDWAPGTRPAGPPRIPWAESVTYRAAGPFPVELGAIPDHVYDPFNDLDTGRGEHRIGSPISPEEAARRREAARLLPPSPRVQQLGPAGTAGLAAQAPVTGAGFDALDYTECCGGGGNVPPDPELAVGAGHVIAVVNVAFKVFDKSGSLLKGPTTFSSFFSGTPGCSSTGVFDPNVLYDESADRFILGIDGNGTDYCIAVSATSDPTGAWYRYGFATDVGGRFFDYPHAGVGRDAIYMGANLFGQVSFGEARVWAIDKAAMYAGASSPTVVTQSTGGDDSPQPMNLHGFQQGSWPTSGPHYVVTDRNYNGATYAVWAWSDPFGANNFGTAGVVDLVSATGVAAGMPLDVPQSGGSNVQANDYRPQDAEYRNGAIWTTQTIACNPGSGTVNCVRWARVDPAGPTVLEAGVFASDGVYRFFGDVAANHCDDMGIGYTKSSSSSYPAVWAAGLESGSPSTPQPEVQLKAGELTYTAFDSVPRRWGDYTELTIDPNGETFWYLGEYSKNTGTSNGRWGTWIGSFTLDCSVVPSDCGNGVIEGSEVCDGADLGGETCSSQGCTGGGTLACNATCDGFDTTLCSDCPVCDNDGTCELGEDCNNCPSDCAAGTASDAACGNGICEAGDGEDCVSCPSDCNGKQNGKPSGRFCCGDGDGQGAVTCSDARCTSGGFDCTDTPAPSGSFCCGDLTCDTGESCDNCALDCGQDAELCDDGVDNDCNGAVDCADGSCLSDPVCTNPSCTPSNEACSSDSECCSGKCRAKGAKAGTCT